MNGYIKISELMDYCQNQKGKTIDCNDIARFPKADVIERSKVDPLTDKEQRIFLAAMSKEEKVCKEVCADGEGVDLVAVCHSIERKVKKALWG